MKKKSFTVSDIKNVYARRALTIVLAPLCLLAFLFVATISVVIEVSTVTWESVTKNGREGFNLVGKIVEAWQGHDESK